MTQHIGIVSVNYEGTSLCYRSICSEAVAVLGEYQHPPITIHSFPLADYMPFIRERNWKGVAEILLRSADHLARSGADFAICPANTVHEAFDFMNGRSPIPFLHIVEVVAETAALNNWSTLGILGTSFLLEGRAYPDVLSKHEIEAVIPSPEQCGKINSLIFDELVKGVFMQPSKEYFRSVVTELAQKSCDAVVLGCTEIPLIIGPDDVEIPLLDSTRLLAIAALKRAIGGASGEGGGSIRPE